MRTRSIVWTGCVAAWLLLGASFGCSEDGNAVQSAQSLQCPAGSTKCGDASPVCSDLQGDPANCGACGNVCAHGQICDLGACTGTPTDGSIPPPPTVDAGPDAPADAPPEASGEAASDARPDAIPDAAHDAAADSTPSDAEMMEGGGNG